MKDKLFSNLLIKVLEKINEIIKNKEIRSTFNSFLRISNFFKSMIYTLEKRKWNLEITGLHFCTSKGLYYITLIRQAVLTEHHVIAFLMQLYNLKNSSICWCCQKIHIIFIFHAIRCICARQRKCILFRLKDYYFTTHLTTQVDFDFISWYSMYTLEMDQGLETWISSTYIRVKKR